MIRLEIIELSTKIARVTNLAYQGKLYSWDSNFAWDQTVKLFNQLESEILKIDIMTLSNDEMKILGFPKFDDKQFCIPCYFHKAAISQGLMTETQDTDNRYGGMWAFVPVKDS